MLVAITDYSSSRRGKWVVVIAWLVAAVVLTAVTPGIGAVLDNDSFGSVSRDAETSRLREVLAERFPSASEGTAAIVVFRNPAGLTEQDRAEIQRLSDLFASDQAPEEVGTVVSVFTQPGAEAGLVSADGTTMTMIVTVNADPLDDAFAETVDYLREQANDVGALEVAVTGPAGIQRDVSAAFENIDTFLTTVTVLLVLVLLIVIYRSPVVAFVPIFSVAWVLVLTFAVASVILKALDLPANAQSQSIMTVLLFGAGTDYCLFIASRYREELRSVEDKHEAMRRTMRSVGESLASAAGTVFVATIALLFAVVPSTRALGPLISVAIVLMLVAGLTLVPAILTLLGRASFWPFRPEYDPHAHRRMESGTEGFWGRIAAFVRAHPRGVLIGTVALFLLTSLPMLRYEPTYDDVAALPVDAESRTGFEMLRQGFPAGELSPTEVYLTLPEGSNALDPAFLTRVDQITVRLAQVEGVAAAMGPTRPFGVAGGPDPQAVIGSLQAAAEGSATGEAAALGGQALSYVGQNRDAVRIELILDLNPFGLDALGMIPELRERVREFGAQAGIAESGVEYWVGGQTAEAYDGKASNDRDTFLLIPVILVAIAVILGLLLRSVIAPLYLVATIVISYFGTLGIGVLFFDLVLGHDGVSGSVAFLSFIFIAALGIDYNIYLMARIREEGRRHGLAEGVSRALSRTGGVITSAGIILAGTFSVLMLLPLQALVQLGFVVAVGVLIDTFITRSLMVPSIVLLLGKWNWWPSHDLAADASRSEPEPTTPRVEERLVTR